ncbi:hypothetical protein AMECASPLE_033791 [Ameca splendens]|uniref:Uncharacterized protein n=1 Tax=Ameca splendens TaxID=208324 RepID=A0ABV0ZUP3_9TELE
MNQNRKFLNSQTMFIQLRCYSKGLKSRTSGLKVKESNFKWPEKHQIVSTLLGPSILVAHFDTRRRRSSDVTGSINWLRCRVSLPFPACLTGQRNGGTYLERQKLAGELLLHKAIPGRA